MSAHTPGPWHFRPLFGRDTFAIFFPDGPMNRRVDDKAGGFNEPDARLIAAAPDLLTAAKEALSSMESIWRTAGHDDDWIYDEMGSELAAGYFSLRAAIAKATGNSP